MSLSPGTRLGVYDVIALIGQGGMGEVYRARDTKLGRDVALKVLPDVFADDPERLAPLQAGSPSPRLALSAQPKLRQWYAAAIHDQSEEARVPARKGGVS